MSLSTLDKTSRAEYVVVVPVYNESQNIRELCSRLIATLSKESQDWCVIFVDDGSVDDSFEILCQLRATEKRIKIVRLSRNFGHQAAISAGLDLSESSATIIMDGDLQDSPEVIPSFIKAWKEGHEVVYAVRSSRPESLIKRIAYSGFYRLLKLVSDIEIPVDAGDFCLMDQRVVNSIRGLTERTRFLRGLRAWVGFRQLGIPVPRGQRNKGRSKYSFGRLVQLAFDGLVAYSFVPLRLISLLGFGLAIIAVSLALFYATKRMTVGLYPPGFATVVVLVCFLAGVQLLTLGLISEYLVRILEETRGRPRYVIRDLEGWSCTAKLTSNE